MEGNQIETTSGAIDHGTTIPCCLWVSEERRPKINRAFFFWCVFVLPSHGIAFIQRMATRVHHDNLWPFNSRQFPWLAVTRPKRVKKTCQFFRVDPLPKSSFWRPQGLRMERRFVTAMHFIGHMLGDIHPIGRQSAHSKSLWFPACEKRQTEEAE
jgi:hypothetical protein